MQKGSGRSERGSEDIEGVNYHSATETTAWFRDRYQEDSLVLKPPYQRKPVWAARQKCYLIESMLLRVPIPEIYIQQTTSHEGRTTYAIVDGQQRIRAVLQFLGAEREPPELEHNKFSLDKLDPESDWYNKTFTDLSDTEKQRIYSYKFVIRYLETDNENEVRDMFRRLNKYLAPLKPQELRNATYIGPFLQLSTRLSDNPYWAENRIVTPATIRRMGDIEFVSELLIGLLHGPQGGSAAVIDEYYEMYEDYEDEFPEQRRIERLFDETLALIQSLFPDIKEMRWGNRADHYSLFVAFGNMLREHRIATSKVAALRAALVTFAAKVDKRLADEQVRVGRDLVNYVRAIEKGVNDKRRRGVRHLVVTKAVSRFFVKRKAP